MGGFYPALPSPTDVKPVNYAARLGGGLALGEEIAGGAMKNEMTGLALQQYKGRQAALKDYTQTGDMSKVMMADPEFGLKLQGELRKMGVEDRKERVEAISKGADFMTKALPFVNEKNWHLFAEDAAKIPMLRGLVPAKYDPEWVKNAIARTDDAKTAVARINAESRKYSADVGLEGRKISADARIGAAGIGADARVKAAEIGAEKPRATSQFEKDYQDESQRRREKGLPEISRTDYWKEREKYKQDIKPGKDERGYQKGRKAKPASTTVLDTKPPASQYKDKYMTDPDGKIFKSDGVNWNPAG